MFLNQKLAGSIITEEYCSMPNKYYHSPKVLLSQGKKTIFFIRGH